MIVILLQSWKGRRRLAQSVRLKSTEQFQPECPTSALSPGTRRERDPTRSVPFRLASACGYALANILLSLGSMPVPGFASVSILVVFNSTCIFFEFQLRKLYDKPFLLRCWKSFFIASFSFFTTSCTVLGVLDTIPLPLMSIHYCAIYSP